MNIDVLINAGDVLGEGVVWHAALQRLSPNHRLVVTLYDIDGLSHGEIAKIMNCSEGTVRSRLFYARLQLQEMLKKYLPEKS